MELAGFHGHFDGVSISLLTQTVDHEVMWTNIAILVCWRGWVKKVSFQCYGWLFIFLSFLLFSFFLSDNPSVFPPLIWDSSGLSLWELKVSIQHSAVSPTTPTPQSHSSDLSSSCHLTLPLIHLFSLSFLRSLSESMSLYFPASTWANIYPKMISPMHNTSSLFAELSRSPSVSEFNFPPHICM